MTGDDWEFVGEFLNFVDCLLDSLPNSLECTGIFLRIVGIQVVSCVPGVGLDSLRLVGVRGGVIGDLLGAVSVVDPVDRGVRAVSVLEEYLVLGTVPNVDGLFLPGLIPSGIRVNPR